MKRLAIILLSVILVVCTFILTNLLHHRGFIFSNTAEAISVSAGLDNMGDNNPFNILLTERLNQIEEERIKILLAEKRAVLEAQRLREERERLERERIEELEKDPNTRFAYLTFDDGPSPNNTPAILDILKEYDIRATFFLIGSMAEKYPEIVKRIYDEGHVIGNHTYSHDYGYIYKNNTNFLKDVEKADRVFKQILGEDFETRLFRFPGGSFGKHKAPMRKAIVDAGYTFYDWNALNGDAEGIKLSNSYLIRRLKETTRNKKNAIILMHDGSSKVGTVETLRENIEYLIAQGGHVRVLEEKH